MANYLTTDTDLEAVADAIRAKGGTSADLVFPSGFVDAIDAIESGGGGNYVASDWLDMEKPEGRIESSTNVSADHFQLYLSYHTKITHVFLTGGLYIPQDFLSHCTALKCFVGTGTRTLNSASAGGCSALTDVDLGVGGGTLATNCLSGCAALNHVILRGSPITVLANINAFSNTPFASGKAGGTLYVPSALISSYQSATNWSTIFGYGNGAQNQILPIEGSIYETQYADGTPIPTT